ncbi:MAG: signal peptidase II [Clostridia bacterium]|nr:signal peptidase II [Clostridia bacterium]
MLIFGILLLIDMVTKLFADAYFSQPDAPSQVDIIPGWISLRITYNRGIAYGMGSDSPTAAKIAVIAATGVLMLALAIMYFKLDKNRVWLRMALVFVVAGGLGNLIDRVYYRVWDADALYGVRDMVDLSRFGFAVCNFADFFISGGAIALVFALLFFDKDALFPTKKYQALAKGISVADVEFAEEAEEEIHG